MLFYRFDTYIYMFLKRSFFLELAPRLERKRIETVVPLIVRVYYILYNARTIGTLFFWKLDMLTLCPEKKQWFISTAGRKETGRSTQFFFEKFLDKIFMRYDTIQLMIVNLQMSAQCMWQMCTCMHVCIINDCNDVYEYVNS